MAILKPGDIVRLKEPYKTHDLAFEHTHNPQVFAMLGYPGRYSREQREAYEAWSGYTHGIVVQALDLGRRVALFLYDPQLGILDMPGNSVIPCYVDFCSDELILLKQGEKCGYDVIDEANRTAIEREFDLS